jgi:hypothetical protein
MTTIHQPRDIEEHMEWSDAFNWLSFEMDKMASCIRHYLKSGEMVLVDTLGQGVSDSQAFNRTIEELRGQGINEEDYRFIRYPSSQKPEHFKKLYVVRK